MCVCVYVFVQLVLWGRRWLMLFFSYHALIVTSYVRMVSGVTCEFWGVTHWEAAGAGRDDDSTVCRSGTGRGFVNGAPERRTPERTDDLPERSS